MKKESVKSLNAAIAHELAAHINTFARADQFDIIVSTSIRYSAARSGWATCKVTISPKFSINAGLGRVFDAIAEHGFFSLKGRIVYGREAGWNVEEATISSRDGWFLTLGY